MTAESEEILIDYNEGRATVQDVLQVCESYNGPATHFLWTRRYTTPFSGGLFDYCLSSFSEAKMIELLQTLIDHNLDFPLLRDGNGTSFLDVALTSLYGQYVAVRYGLDVWSCPTAFPRFFTRIAVPRTARSSHSSRRHPLHKACSIPGIDPAVVDHLIDLDTDVLVEPDGTNAVPLHYALRHNPTAPFVARMIELRPAALRSCDSLGWTPVAVAIERLLNMDGREAAAVLEGLVRRCPEAVVLSSKHAPLFHACSSLHSHPHLVEAIVHADPIALAFSSWGFRDNSLLPFEIVPTVDAAAATRALVEKETWELALAVVECALMGYEYDNGSLVDRGGGAHESGSLAGRFFGHVRRKVADFLTPGTGDARSSTSFPSSLGGFEVAQALRHTLKGDRDSSSNNRNNRSQMDLCRALFRFSGDTATFSLGQPHRPRLSHARARLALSFCLPPPCRPPSPIRAALTGNTTIAGLYRLNSRGRLDPLLPHQVALLESIKDDLDCVFLHLRVAPTLLLPPRGEVGVELGADNAEEGRPVVDTVPTPA
jgi:hypothetical protein